MSRARGSCSQLNILFGCRYLILICPHMQEEKQRDKALLKAVDRPLTLCTV